jgi:hypothetical protein
MVNYDIADESELKSLVRTLTGYDNNTVSNDDLENHIQIAQLRLTNKVDLDTSTSGDPFYDDIGLSQALLFTTALFTKAEVENVSVDSWDVGDVFIETRRAGDDEQAQFQQWAEYVREGIQSSDVTDIGPLPNVSHSYP